MIWSSHYACCRRSAAFLSSNDGVFLHSRSDGHLINIARLRSKSKINKVLIGDLLFADDAAIVSHTQDGLQRLMDKFSQACNLFRLTISQKKTQVMGQGTSPPPTITVKGEKLETVDQFQYL